MDLVHHSERVKAIIASIKNSGKSVGFVPTMGALHQGHLSLVKQARQENDFVVVSIYVNPTQFNQKEDLDKYPRTMDRDMALLDGYCDLVFNPLENKEVYGEEIKLKEYDFEGLDTPLEGAFRPGHFKGMANVVNKLFEIVSPSKAYFGLKDYQQYVLVKKMVAIEKLPIEIIGCPIVREEHGLAMSSRNERLSDDGRAAAGVIYYALSYCEKFGKYFPLAELQKKASSMIEGILEVEYLDFRDAETLEPLNELHNNGRVFLSFAGYIDGVRLIDNVRF